MSDPETFALTTSIHCPEWTIFVLNIIGILYVPGSVAAGAPIVIPSAAKKSRDFVSEHPESAKDAINRIILSMWFMEFVVLNVFFWTSLCGSRFNICRNTWETTAVASPPANSQKGLGKDPLDHGDLRCQRQLPESPPGRDGDAVADWEENTRLASCCPRPRVVRLFWGGRGPVGTLAEKKERFIGRSANRQRSPQSSTFGLQPEHSPNTPT